MKFEAKRDADGDPAPAAAGTPWTSIQAAAAQSACEELQGTGDFAQGTFSLVSNPEWMTIARDIEGTPANWSGGAVGSGHVPQGHSDGAPSNVLAAADPDDPYDGTGNNAGQAAGSGWEQRRTHVLTGGGVVWDLAGNVAEWVDWRADDDGYSDPPAPGFLNSYNEIDLSRDTIPEQAGADDPLVADDLLPSGPHDHRHSLGQWLSLIAQGGGDAHTVYRGGFYNDNGRPASVGVFALSLSPTETAAVIGFRCVWRPPSG